MHRSRGRGMMPDYPPLRDYRGLRSLQPSNLSYSVSSVTSLFKPDWWIVRR